MILIFLGPPGAGKGTQAQLLEKKSGFRQISTGDLLRAHRSNKTELGLEAQGYMDRGELVPDDLIIRMMERELDGVNDAILDGFPRTVAQATALDELLQRKGRSLPGAILFDVDDRVLMERLAGRLTHVASGRTYHTKFNPPRVAGHDDVTNDLLVQRDDDKEETVRKRLATYHDQTAPLVKFYDRSDASGMLPGNRLTTVNAFGEINAIAAQIAAAAGVHPGVCS